MLETKADKISEEYKDLVDSFMAESESWFRYLLGIFLNSGKEMEIYDVSLIIRDVFSIRGITVRGENDNVHWREDVTLEEAYQAFSDFMSSEGGRLYGKIYLSV